MIKRAIIFKKDKRAVNPVFDYVFEAMLVRVDNKFYWGFTKNISAQSYRGKTSLPIETRKRLGKKYGCKNLFIDKERCKRFVFPLFFHDGECERYDYGIPFREGDI